MATVYLSLGSNLGNSADYLKRAQAELVRYGIINAESSLYTTEPVDYLDQPWFLNQIIKFTTQLDPETLLVIVQKIEKKLGRERAIRFGPRTIDIDILFYDAIMLETPKLVIPHPRLHERRFVLAPLAQIAPEFRHPALQKTIVELLQTVADTSTVQKI